MEKEWHWSGRGGDGRGGAGVAGRLRESGEPLVGARDGAEEGDCGAIVAGRQPLAIDSAIVDRKLDDFGDWRSDRSVVGDVAARSGADFHAVAGYTDGGSYKARRAGAALHVDSVARDGRALRTRSRFAGDEDRSGIGVERQRVALRLSPVAFARRPDSRADLDVAVAADRRGVGHTLVAARQDARPGIRA